MKRIDLGGSWTLTRDDGETLHGKLPGCTYLDYIANGMEDPFWGENETKATMIARHEYTYSRTFPVEEEFLSAKQVELTASGVDTLCTVVLNGTVLEDTDNINRLWRFSVKSLLHTGENVIELRFHDPYPYMEARQAEEPLFGAMGNGKGATHLRKTACHFGWDWGPELPPAGITDFIRLESYDARLEEIRITQHHGNGVVRLEVSLETGEQEESFFATLRLYAPDGKEAECSTAFTEGKAKAILSIKNPQLWWCNGLGGQPLYTLEVSLLRDGEVLDVQSKRLGLRTIELDTAPDKYGNQFRFLINGVPIFAKGADWIPGDSFITRFGKEETEFYVKSVRDANMNMLRVWGGGRFESEDFYDACDKYGILVWQDFLFACGAYPLHHPDFLENVYAEVKDNVQRLRHRASLALWCGNNENEFFSMFWKKDSPEKNSNPEFYFKTLRDWVNELDGATPYWPGSPSSGIWGKRVQSRKKGEIRGDSHLWQIWHGMRPYEAFRKLPTRFCSEFGMESFPAMGTIQSFADKASLDLFSPVMQLHQKSSGGNEKILYYLLMKYPNPESFEDFIYLSQLVQANTVRFATDCWRRRFGFTNGCLFWQLNDCWPTASWAGIDYEKQWKAVMYHACHFNKPLCLSNDYYPDRAELWVENDLPKDFSGNLEWEIMDFRGDHISGGKRPVSVPKTASSRVAVLPYRIFLRLHKKEDVFLRVRLLDGETVRDEKSWLLVPDKAAHLPKAQIDVKCTVTNGIAEIALKSPTYARYVSLENDIVSAPWSDNFFDLLPGEEKTVTVKLPKDTTTEEFPKRLKVRSFTDVKAKNGRFIDRLLQLQMIFRKKNYLTWLMFRFI